MSVTFIKKLHTCTKCGKKDYELIAIKSLTDITSNFPIDRQPKVLKDRGIYVEKIVRDSDGIILHRLVEEKICHHCHTFNLEADKTDKDINILNFYPPTEASKWADGFAKVGL